MIQHFDRAEEGRQKERRKKREEGKEAGERKGWRNKAQAAPKNHVNAEIIKELFGIHGSGWHISREKSH